MTFGTAVPVCGTSNLFISLSACYTFCAILNLSVFFIHIKIVHAGTEGREILLRTNVFPVRMPQQYCLYQYHVSFNPEVPSTFIRKAMVAEKREYFGDFYMFDGMQLFLQIRLENDVSLFTQWYFT